MKPIQITADNKSATLIVSPAQDLAKLIEDLRQYRDSLNCSDSLAGFKKKLRQLKEVIFFDCSGEPLIEDLLSQLNQLESELSTQIDMAEISNSKMNPAHRQTLYFSLTHAIDILNSINSCNPFPYTILSPLISENHALAWAAQLDPLDSQTPQKIGLFLLHVESFRVSSILLIEFYRCLRHFRHHPALPTLKILCEASIEAANNNHYRDSHFYELLQKLAETLIQPTATSLLPIAKTLIMQHLATRSHATHYELQNFLIRNCPHIHSTNAVHLQTLATAQLLEEAKIQESYLSSNGTAWELILPTISDET